jgi:hypothetical protein
VGYLIGDAARVSFDLLPATSADLNASADLVLMFVTYTQKDAAFDLVTGCNKSIQGGLRNSIAQGRSSAVGKLKKLHYILLVDQHLGNNEKSSYGRNAADNPRPRARLYFVVLESESSDSLGHPFARRGTWRAT